MEDGGLVVAQPHGGLLEGAADLPGAGRAGEAAIAVGVRASFGLEAVAGAFLGEVEEPLRFRRFGGGTRLARVE